MDLALRLHKASKTLSREYKCREQKIFDIRKWTRDIYGHDRGALHYEVASAALLILSDFVRDECRDDESARKLMDVFGKMIAEGGK
jgi:hypothetical protein